MRVPVRSLSEPTTVMVVLLVFFFDGAVMRTLPAPLLLAAPVTLVLPYLTVNRSPASRPATLTVNFLPPATFFVALIVRALAGSATSRVALAVVVPFALSPSRCRWCGRAPG